MSGFARGCLVAGWLLLGGPLSSVRADIGPRLEEPRIRIRVLRAGEPLSASAQFVLLAPSKGKEKPQWKGIQRVEEPMKKALEPRSLPDSEGGYWGPAFCHNRTPSGFNGVQFNYFRAGYPPRVRLAVYLPSDNKLFITEEAHTGHYITDLKADLAEDGSGTLVDSSPGMLGTVLGILGENLGALGQALLLTIVIELAVLALCARIARQWDRMGRLVGLCVLGNLLTVPAVWFGWVYATVELDVNRALLVYLFAELAAVTFEGWLYAKVCGLRPGPALLWSFLANAASVLFGCCLVGLPV
jgi:hypothetical protein